MIDTNLIKQIMGRFPDFNFQLIPNNQHIKIIAEKGSDKSPGIGYYRISKELSVNDDLSKLEEVLKEKSLV